eukprot:9489955-Pyramimonas_sp.AAC.1
MYHVRDALLHAGLAEAVAVAVLAPDVVLGLAVLIIWIFFTAAPGLAVLIIIIFFTAPGLAVLIIIAIVQGSGGALQRRWGSSSRPLERDLGRRPRRCRLAAVPLGCLLDPADEVFAL